MRALHGILIVAAVGCSSSSGSNSGGISGAMPGGHFTLADTISAAVTTDDGAGGTDGYAQIVLANTSDLCSDAGASPPIDRKLQRFVVIQLRNVNGAMHTAPTAPGTYTVYSDSGSEPAQSASLLASGFDENCAPVDSDAGSGQTGSVMLTSIANGAFTGSFDVVLDTGGEITGSFDPEPCPALEAVAMGTVPHSCM